jgi:pimeloyl-ACP methyl ester carboxylesterase
MDSHQRLGVRFPVALLCTVGVVIVILACDGASTRVQATTRLTLCAVDVDQSSACTADDFQRHATIAGDFRGVNTDQTIHVQVTASGSGQPQANASVAFTVTGPNAQRATATTDADGIASLTYTGMHPGTDSITVAPPSGVKYSASSPEVVHWLTRQSFDHPIIFLHGINEDANVIAHHQEWTSLFEALRLTYNTSDIETFCYVDDFAYRDASPPAYCPGPSYRNCTSVDTSGCISESSVDANAVQLAERVMALHTRTGKSVTLMGYSMGAAITRTMVAGCRNTPVGVDSDADSDTDVGSCNKATQWVDQAFFFNGVQQGSWLMKVKQGADAVTLAGDNIPSGPASPFFSVLPILEQRIFDEVKSRIGPDPNSDAAKDLTPLSQNIRDHNMVSVPGNVKVYTFYGAIQLHLDVNVFAYHLGGPQPLPLGDLALLAQQDMSTAIPAWGGASLCDDCTALDPSGYHGSQKTDQFHAWALLKDYHINLADIIPSVGPTLQDVFNSPVTHLNISQPIAQAPGSAVRVEDITHMATSSTTDMADEILDILKQNDGIIGG